MMGPCVKKLIAMRMAAIAIPRGGGLADGIKFLSTKESIMAGGREASKFVEQALDLMREAAEPNVWRTASDEEIAAHILREIERRTKKSTVSCALPD